MHTRPFGFTDIGQILEATSFVLDKVKPHYIAYPDDDIFLCVPTLLKIAMALPRMNVIMTSASWMKNFRDKYSHPDGNFLLVSADMARHILAEAHRKKWISTYTYGILFDDFMRVCH